MRVDLKLVLLAVCLLYVVLLIADTGVNAQSAREKALKEKAVKSKPKQKLSLANYKRKNRKRFKDPKSVGKQSKYVNKGGAPKRQSGSEGEDDPHVGNREVYIQKYFKGKVWGVKDKVQAPKRTWRKKLRKAKHPKKKKRDKMKQKEATVRKAVKEKSAKKKNKKKKASKRKKRKRNKRYAITNEERMWDFGVIPYHFTDVVTESMALTYTGVFDALEKRTCITFEKWDGTEKFYSDRDLNHLVHLNFINEGGCWAYYGRFMHRTTNIAQNISCCLVGRTCLHEILHSLSMEHEHTSPLREGWLRMNWANLNTLGVDAFQMTDNLMLDHESWGFDIKSFVSYGTGTYTSNEMLGYQPLNPDYWPTGDSYWQPMKEIQLNYDCFGIKCGGMTEPVCENDGYPGYYNKQCGCVCPPGLDPATNCATPRVTASLSGWPDEPFGLMEPIEGCPDGFEMGSMLHPMAGDSDASYSSHINAGFENSTAELGYCVKSATTGGLTEWPRGQYCIHSYGGACPKGFIEGMMTFDDLANETHPIVSSQPLPDGSFENNTKLWYCCRSDGMAQLEIKLPNTEAFILYRYGTSECQKVDGMYVFPEYYTFINAGEVTSTGEAVFSVLGEVPLNMEDDSSVYMYYCYYSPLNYNCGEVVHLDENNPNKDIMTPNYPYEYPNNIECNWLFVAPEGSEVKLNFNDFDIEGDDTDCYDYVTIRRYLPGIPGTSYCGAQFKATVQSIDRYLMITFTSGGETGYAGFHATARLVNANDSCYNPEDFGRSYNGQHNFAGDFTDCLPWSEMAHCPTHPFRTADAFENLDGNYCRNPGALYDGPWCYTEKENCTIQYCDVCQERTIYDNFDDCDELIQANPNFCLDGDDHHRGCLETCVGVTHITLPPVPLRALDITCPPPLNINDAVPLADLLPSYDVGDTVIYECATGSATKISHCLSDGTWTDINYVCGGCGDEMVSDDRGSCYVYVPDQVRFVEAEEYCYENFWNVSTAKTEEDFNFLVSLRKSTGAETKKVWLDLYEDPVGEWRWGDDLSLVQDGYTNWISSYPVSGPVETDGNNWYQCVVMTGSGTGSIWSQVACDSKWYLAHFICKTEESVMSGCADRKRSCVTNLLDNALFCSAFSTYAHEICPFTCGRCGLETATLCSVTSDLLTGLDLVVDGILSPLLTLTLKPGQSFTVTCPAGQVCVENCKHLSRACDRSGQITGATPVCKDEDTVPSFLNNIERIPRQESSDGRRVYQGDNSYLNITRSGEITKWMAYCENDGAVYMMVFTYWSHNRYFKVLGVNEVECKAGRRITWAIPEGQRIQVEPSMRIGFMDWNGGSVPVQYCDAGIYPDLAKVYSTAVTSIDEVQLNKLIWFRSGPACTYFSLDAEISPVGYVPPVTPQLTTTTVAPEVTATEDVSLFTSTDHPEGTSTSTATSTEPIPESSSVASSTTESSTAVSSSTQSSSPASSSTESSTAASSSTESSSVASSATESSTTASSSTESSSVASSATESSTAASSSTESSSVASSATESITEVHSATESSTSASSTTVSTKPISTNVPPPSTTLVTSIPKKTVNEDFLDKFLKQRKKGNWWKKRMRKTKKSRKKVKRKRRPNKKQKK